MAAGLPIVAADAPGIPDILLGGAKAAGIMVPRDDPDSFAEALGRLLDDAKLRADLSEQARKRVEFEFSLDAVGTKLKDFFNQNSGRVSESAARAG
jgi:glycosyltransferase involved in cell wall biosynthesis